MISITTHTSTEHMQAHTNNKHITISILEERLSNYPCLQSLQARKHAKLSRQTFLIDDIKQRQK